MLNYSLSKENYRYVQISPQNFRLIILKSSLNNFSFFDCLSIWSIPQGYSTNIFYINGLPMRLDKLLSKPLKIKSLISRPKSNICHKFYFVAKYRRKYYKTLERKYVLNFSFYLSEHKYL